ncbi:hypothetical protein L3X37_04870 [Sabulilitoribacter arenilitoris]|uniref:Uncharacterized protein n=1 Tax=Wocania arenilitoris TaxID=2044858 RepID=A0AAE3JL18_9FLAO|nr:hypothetical protein [Wocania arenilitoris]MCF7567697.1 hypothetical protein [Wocania arenilitoris]
MNTIDFFKLQSKNLHRDFKTRKLVFNNEFGKLSYEYEPKHFDIELVIYDYNLDEENFTLMKAQHVIAHLAGFEKWTVLIKTSETDLKIAKILYENQDIIDLRMWKDYISEAEIMNQTNFDSETKLAICEQAFEMGVFNNDVFFDCYLLDKK